jgi:2'-5' RNA ligase superfamily
VVEEIDDAHSRARCGRAASSQIGIHADCDYRGASIRARRSRMDRSHSIEIRPSAERRSASFHAGLPLQWSPVDAVLEHAAHVASQTEPSRFVLRSALAVKDTFTASSHVFLLPDEGSSAVVALHRSLNSGHLAPIARTDVPFTPHVTVAALEDPEQASAVADELNASGDDFRNRRPRVGWQAVREILRIELRR